MQGGNYMGKRDLRKVRRIMAAMLCAFVFMSFVPDVALALDEKPAAEQAEEPAESSADAAATAGSEADLTPAVPEDTVPAEIPADIPDDSDALLEGYLDAQLRAELAPPPSKKLLRKAESSKRRETLNEGGKLLYDGCAELAGNIAAGTEEDSVIEIDVSSLLSRYYVRRKIGGAYYNVITSQSLGISSPVWIKKGGKWTFSDEAKAKLFDFEKVTISLLLDEPYSFYWYDKTTGVKYTIPQMLVVNSGTASDIFFKETDEPVFQASFPVSAEYRADEDDSYLADTSKTGAASAAVTNAAAIITDNTGKSDVDKLTAYKDKICELVSYDRASAGKAYGNVWQMIYVFDNDPETNVVCEGYSKAFQYLCDHTDFNSGLIECDSAYGTVAGTGQGLHMWNILHMDDGENYIADLTNSDSRTIGYRGGLFLSGAMEGGSVSSGYSYDTSGNGAANINYYYDEDMHKVFSESELMMAGADYSGPHTLIDPEYTWADDGSSCIATCRCADCEEILVRQAAVTSSVKTAASCTAPGTTVYTAVFRQSELETQTKDIADIPATGHSYSVAVTKAASEGVPGVITCTCSRCGDSYTEAVPAIAYKADLPAVKIAKPKAGKKKVTVRWKKVSKKNRKKIQGIEIQIATDKGFTNIVKTVSGSKKKTSKAVKGLKAKTKYYVRIRAYKNAADGKHVSAWKTKTVKIK